MTRLTVWSLPVSRITLGTMRLPDADPVALLEQAFARGITSFHCSAEYASFATFAQAWQRAGLGRRGATLIAKVAAPHYGDDSFDPATLCAKVDATLQALAVERIDVLQWLLRYDLRQEDARLAILAQAADALTEVVATLKRAGKIGAFVGFPYTIRVADGLIAADYCDGLALYVNPLEREMDDVVARCGAAGKPVVAIRPFAAGRVFTETSATAADALDHVFAYAPVATAVVSASSATHLDALAPYARG